MKRFTAAPAASLALLVVLVLAFAVRFRPAFDARLSAGERGLGMGEWLIDDPLTTHHLRRIELGIAASRVPESDRFLAHPAGAEIPILPTYDALVAGFAQRFLPRSDAEPALGGVAESDLESVAIHFGPWLGVLGALAVCWAARAVVAPASRGVAPLLAAAIFALAPAAVCASAAGILDPMALALVLGALFTRSVLRALASEELLGATLEGLMAGVLCGVLISVTGAGYAAYLSAWIALLVEMFRRPVETRPAAIRAGVGFAAVTAFVSRLPLFDGPWEASGTLAETCKGLSTLLMLMTLPFLVAFLVPKGQRPRPFQVICFVLALALLIYEVPSTWEQVRPLLAWFSEQRAAIHTAVPMWDPLVAGPWSSSLLFIPVLLFAAIVARAARADRRALFLACFLTASAALGWIHGAWSTLVWVPVSVSAAVVLARIVTHMSPRAASACAAALLLLTGVPTALSCLTLADPARREESIEFVTGLRWLREHTPAPGAFNSAHSPADWAVLCDPLSALLVHYHARRPTVTCVLDVLEGLEVMADVDRALCETDPAHALRLLEVGGVRYVVTGPRSRFILQDHQRGPGPFAQVPSLTNQGFLLSLALASQGSASQARLRLIYTSRRIVDEHFQAALDSVGARAPVISIYESSLAGSTKPREAVLTPR